jgi:hypothetical protein
VSPAELAPVALVRLRANLRARQLFLLAVCQHLRYDSLIYVRIQRRSCRPVDVDTLTPLQR